MLSRRRATGIRRALPATRLIALALVLASELPVHAQEHGTLVLSIAGE